MNTTLKRIFALLLTFVMLCSFVPGVSALEAEAEQNNDKVLTQADYDAVDALFDQIDAMEGEPAKKNSTQTQLADEAQALVLASEDYVEGSLERNGNFFTWWTTQGICCAYSPRMRSIRQNMTPPEEPLADGVYNEPSATKGTSPSSNDVYLIGPYYGSDVNFTNQYKYEAQAIAQAIGDTDGYTLYSGTAATVDAIAKAVSSGAVVIFDSHGTTDYESGDDFVTGAKNSYLCIESGAGMTYQDYLDGARYGSDYAYLNGQAIANHMTTDSPSGMVWMAICLGMATDTLCAPLRERGVEVVYGYSQSVYFEGDYLFEDAFWDSMCAGENVATAIADMKAQWGDWDWSDEIAGYYGYSSGYSTISQARSNYAAFPVVVSDEDAHPGQRKGSFYGADSLQTVRSTYTLFTQYSVSARANNTAYGSVSVSGNRITATPAQGYFAESAQVVQGNATVNQSGNVFSVFAQSDCVIQINFAPKTPVTVTFSGASVPVQTGYAGDAMTLPKAAAPEGYSFVGWLTSPLTGATSQKPEHLSQSFVPTQSTTLYALYSYVDENTSTGTGDYVKVTADRGDWSGEYVIVYEPDGYVFNSSLSSMDQTNNYKAVSISNQTISAQEADPYKFTVSPYGSGYAIQGTSGYYIGNSSSNNGLSSLSSPEAQRITLDTNYNASIISAGGGYLRFNKNDGQYRFRYYKASSYSSQQPVALYVKDGAVGTTYYLSVLCDHENTQQVAATAPTCTQVGYTAGVYCNDCKSYIEGHQEVPATGHDFVLSGLTYTCQNCHGSYETFYLHFSVPAGVIPVPDAVYTNGGILLPQVTDPEGYKFLGWTTSPVSDAENQPVTYPENQLYTATQEHTLYALFSYEKQSQSSGSYTLVTSADQLKSGVKVVLASNEKSFVAGAMNGAYLSNVSASFSTDKSKITSLPGSALVLTLSASGNNWVLMNSQGQSLGATTLKKLAWDNGTTTWSISFSGNNATVQNTTSSYGRFMYNVNSPRFTTYTSTPSSSMLMPQLYMQGPGSVTLYTTEITGLSCDHQWDEGTVLTAPGCEEEGVMAYTCTLCSVSYEAPIASTGHTYGDWTITQEPTYLQTGVQTQSCACGHSVSQTLDLLSIPVRGWNLELKEDIGIHFGLKLIEEEATQATVKITAGDTVIESPVTDLPLNVQGYYMITVDVSASYMTLPVTVTLTVGDREVTRDYSVQGYAQYILDEANGFDEATKDMVQAMLHYGAAAQKYFDCNADSLANQGLEDTVNAKIPASGEVSPLSFSGKIPGVSFYAASLLLRENVSLRYYFKLAEGCKPENYTFRVNGQVCTPVASEELYYIQFDRIYPQQLGQSYTLSVTQNADDSASIQVDYGPLTYITRQYEKTEKVLLKNLLQQLYDYYLAAQAM